MDHRHNAVGRLARVLMLPDTENRPPGRAQLFVGMEISATVGFDLVPPELGVGLGPRGVQRVSIRDSAARRAPNAWLRWVPSGDDRAGPTRSARSRQTLGLWSTAWKAALRRSSICSLAAAG